MTHAGDPTIGRGSALAARLRSLARSARARDAEGVILVEGVRLVEEALRAGTAIREVIVSPRLNRDDRGRALLERLRALRVPLHAASDRLMDSFQDAGTHQGCLLVAARPATVADLIPSGVSRATLLVAAGIQDPGNTGALLRVAEASGAVGCLVAGGADPFGPKAARASAGALFRLPIRRVPDGEPLAAEIERLRSGGCVVLAALPRGGRDYREVPFDRTTAIVMGEEGGGLPEDLVVACDGAVTVPLKEGVESINVTSAAALILFEAERRRRQVTAPPPPREG